MPSAFDYAIVRVVPRVERGEQINVGVIVSCPALTFLAATIAFEPARLHALWPEADTDAISRALELVPWIAAGDPRGGPISTLPRSERFHWLIAPRSAIVQTSPTHAGLCDDPAVALAELVDRLVRVRTT